VIIGFLFLLGNQFLISLGEAQGEKPNAINSFQKFRNVFGGQDMLQETFNKVEHEKTEREGRLLGVDGETALMLKRMRNPFEAQIPRPVVEEPAIDDTPNPEPEPIIDEQLPFKVNEETIPMPTEDDYIITGLIWNSDRPQAVVNGRIIDVGDQLDYWKVSSFALLVLNTLIAEILSSIFGISRKAFCSWLLPLEKMFQEMITAKRTAKILTITSGRFLTLLSSSK